MVTKLRLTSLDETGSVVGRLSGHRHGRGDRRHRASPGSCWSRLVPVSTILVGLGVLLVVAAVVVERRGPRLAAARRAHRVVVVARRARGRGRARRLRRRDHLPLRRGRGRTRCGPTAGCCVLDGVRHSYVDLADPTHLEFAYVRAMAAVVDASYAAGEPVRAYHLGGGGLTLPRWLAEVRPGTREHGLGDRPRGGGGRRRAARAARPGDDLDVRVEDGRTGLRRLDDDSRDLVVGDAFGGVSIPFHLTTAEAWRRCGGCWPPTGSTSRTSSTTRRWPSPAPRSATLLAVFDHVAVAASPEALARGGRRQPGAAGRRRAARHRALAARGSTSAGPRGRCSAGPRLEAWVGDAEVLTDDRAPVDQLLTPYE